MKRSGPPQRKTPMKRGPGPKRTGGPKRKRVNSPYGTKRGKSLLDAKEIAVANRQAFRQEARAQRVCAVCGNPGSYDAHHVIEKKYLKANHLEQYNTENCLRVCDELATDSEGKVTDCHGKHTNGSKRIPMSCLTDRNIAYAFRLLGQAAYYYLRDRYEGMDPRVERAFEELEERAA